MAHNIPIQSLDPDPFQNAGIFSLSGAVRLDRVPPAQVDLGEDDNRSPFHKGFTSSSGSPSSLSRRAMDGQEASRTEGSSEPVIPSSVAREAALVRAAVAGDRTALSDLLRLARRLALRQALARTQDPEDSEDVAQEVSVRVLISLPSFRFRSRFSSWVYRITENEIGTLLRKKTSVAKVEHLVSLNLPAFAFEPHSDKALDAERLRDAVNEAVEDLPDLQDRTFRLVALQHLRPREAASVLGKSQTNIRASLSRARVKIQQSLLEKVPALVGDLR